MITNSLPAETILSGIGHIADHFLGLVSATLSNSQKVDCDSGAGPHRDLELHGQRRLLPVQKVGVLWEVDINPEQSFFLTLDFLHSPHHLVVGLVELCLAYSCGVGDLERIRGNRDKKFDVLSCDELVEIGP